MRTNRRFLLGLALGAPLAAASRAETPSPDSDVPQNHWVYDALMWFMQLGFDPGYPVGTYSGKPAFTRQQFAVFTANIAEGADWWAQRGWPRRPRYVLAWQGPDPLVRLTQEFERELRLIDAWNAEFQHSLARFAQVFRDGRPQGVRVPLVHPIRRYDENARRRGRDRAAQAWERGEPYLLLNRTVPDRVPRPPRAIPLRYTKVPDEDRLSIQEIAGHNEEMWRLFRVRGEFFVPLGAAPSLDGAAPSVKLSSRRGTCPRARDRAPSEGSPAVLGTLLSYVTVAIGTGKRTRLCSGCRRWRRGASPARW